MVQFKYGDFIVIIGWLSTQGNKTQSHNHQPEAF